MWWMFAAFELGRIESFFTSFALTILKLLYTPNTKDVIKKPIIKNSNMCFLR